MQDLQPDFQQQARPYGPRRGPTRHLGTENLSLGGPSRSKSHAGNMIGKTLLHPRSQIPARNRGQRGLRGSMHDRLGWRRDAGRRAAGAWLRCLRQDGVPRPGISTACETMAGGHGSQHHRTGEAGGPTSWARLNRASSGCGLDARSPGMPPRPGRGGIACRLAPSRCGEFGARQGILNRVVYGRSSHGRRGRRGRLSRTARCRTPTSRRFSRALNTTWQSRSYLSRR